MGVGGLGAGRGRCGCRLEHPAHLTVRITAPGDGRNRPDDGRDRRCVIVSRTGVVASGEVVWRVASDGIPPSLVKSAFLRNSVMHVAGPLRVSSLNFECWLPSPLRRAAEARVERRAWSESSAWRLRSVARRGRRRTAGGGTRRAAAYCLTYVQSDRVPHLATGVCLFA